MPPLESRQRYLVKVARLYYEDNLTQEEIGARLQLSRSKVVRLLQEARREGIVQIHVVAPRAVSDEIERQLERRFGLRQAVVAEADGAGPDEARAAVAREAAALLAETLRQDAVLAMSSGTTLAAVAEAMVPMRNSGVTIVEFEGLISAENEDSAYGEYQIATRLAQTLQARYRFLPVPRELGSPDIVAAVRADPRIRNTLDLARHADILLVGVGGLAPLSPTLRHLTPDAVRELADGGAVGEIAARFFDAAGRPCTSRLDQCLIGLELAELAGIPVRIAVSFGLPKVPALAGVLRGGHVNILVTDSQTAQALLTAAPPAAP